jgi:hypothetical protein
MPAKQRWQSLPVRPLFPKSLTTTEIAHEQVSTPDHLKYHSQPFIHGQTYFIKVHCCHC